MTKVEKKEDRTLVMTDSGEIISDSRFEVMPAHPRSISDARRARYLRATIDSVSVEEWAEICEKQKQLALEGDRGAVQWLEKYLIGGTDGDITAALHEEEDADTGKRLRRVLVVLRGIADLADR